MSSPITRRVTTTSGFPGLVAGVGGNQSLEFAALHACHRRSLEHVSYHEQQAGGQFANRL
jgi:hypothetical protein